MRRLLAWALFLAGDGVSRIMRVADGLRLYGLYNRLMIWSSIVQGPSDRGPWTAIAIEAGTAGTTKIGPVHESAGPQDIAQKPIP